MGQSSWKQNPRCRSGHIIHLACYIFYILDICRLPLGNQMYIFYVQRWPPSSLPCLESCLIFAREILPLRQLARRVEQEKAKKCIEPSWHVFNTHGRKSTGGLLMIFGVLRCMSSTTIHHHLNTGPPHPLSPSGAGGGWANWIGTPVASKEVTLRISWKEVTYASLIFVSGLFAFWV